MEIVVGTTLKSIKPRVWDPNSPFFLKEVRAIMVSYAEFDQMRSFRKKAMKHGLHTYLGVPEEVKIYLDNGSFSFHRKGREVPRDEYEAFVEAAKPDWYPTPQDYIPAPAMNWQKQVACRVKTMEVNKAYSFDGHVPVLHIGRYIDRYLDEIQEDSRLREKQHFALGGIVPNLLRAPKALPYKEIIDGVRRVRAVLGSDKTLHLFGVGGTATLHLAALLEIDSVDSTGWRNRAARGIVQLPGSGDRVVAELGSWRGREPSEEEWELLRQCSCPACLTFGINGLKRDKVEGFRIRATHNLWVLLQEAKEIKQHLAKGTYEAWYEGHIDNSIYKSLIDYAFENRIHNAA